MTKQEQTIDAVLSRRYGELDPATLEKITEDDVLAYVVSHGFPQSTVYEPTEYWEFRRDDADDYWCMAEWTKGEWHVFYVERGQQQGLQTVPDRLSAERMLVHKIMKIARRQAIGGRT